ncbi:MAG: ATP-dependent Clp protease proteolytic subunit [bacterium]|nr:ATP-dependent Clp protease proteolytic subunit [bacterium]
MPRRFAAEVDTVLTNIFWFIIILSIIYPMLQQRLLLMNRLRYINQLERKRSSRLILLIHRQESVSLFGIPFYRYIDINDSEEVLRAIRLTDDDVSIDIVLHTPGGLVLAAEQIASALKNHKARVTVFIPHYAMSGGTMLALAADNIVMDYNAVLGPVDPQLGEYPAISVLRAVSRKTVDKIDDKTLILADMAEKAMVQVERFMYGLIRDRYPEEKARAVTNALTSGSWTHDYPLSFEEIKSMGLEVSCDMPEEIYELMGLYPQPAQRRPSVQYIPIPYTKER